jgi:two-component system cell cycle sensor histidine kinase PleC
VSDTGVGISPEHIPVVLEPFGQARTNAHLAHEGTGLGLSLSRQLIELHGGALEIESEVDRGTTVTIKLPPERVVSG